MNEIHNKRLTGNSKTLRKNMTKEERKLWYEFLKQLPLTIHRQKVIGEYIVDFYVASAKVVIELDGSQHYEDKGVTADTKRDAALSELGLTVLRYSNLDVQRNFNAVCQDILNNITPAPPSP